MAQGKIDKAVASVLPQGTSAPQGIELERATALLASSAHFSRMVENAEALVATVRALKRAQHPSEAIDGVMSALQHVYRWSYATFWSLQPDTELLRRQRSPRRVHPSVRPSLQRGGARARRRPPRPGVGRRGGIDVWAAGSGGH